MNKQQIKDKITELQNKLKEIEDKEMVKKIKLETIEIDGWEYEIETHDFDKNLSEIEIPKGWELWNYEDCIKLHNNPKFRKSLNLEDCWFFVKQPFKFNEEKGFVAWFYADSDGAGLDVDGGSACAVSSLGVRFKRKIRRNK